MRPIDEGSVVAIAMVALMPAAGPTRSESLLGRDRCAQGVLCELIAIDGMTPWLSSVCSASSRSLNVLGDCEGDADWAWINYLP